MNKFESLIDRLEKPKRNGFNVRARCPVHGSKGQTLSVTEKEGGYIVAHCFACGADGLELVKALGLPVSVLFPDDREYVAPSITRKMKEENIQDVLMLFLVDGTEGFQDKKRLRKCRERVKGFQQKFDLSLEYAPSLNHPALKELLPDYEEPLKQSPALRAIVVESFWSGVVSRVMRSYTLV